MWYSVTWKSGCCLRFFLLLHFSGQIHYQVLWFHFTEICHIHIQSFHLNSFFTVTILSGNMAAACSLIVLPPAGLLLCVLHRTSRKIFLKHRCDYSMILQQLPLTHKERLGYHSICTQSPAPSLSPTLNPPLHCIEPQRALLSFLPLSQPGIHFSLCPLVRTPGERPRPSIFSSVKPSPHIHPAKLNLPFSGSPGVCATWATVLCTSYWCHSHPQAKFLENGDHLFSLISAGPAPRMVLDT